MSRVTISQRGSSGSAATPQGSGLDRLRAAGEVDPASQELDDLPEPLDVPAGVEPPSAALARLRREER